MVYIGADLDSQYQWGKFFCQIIK